MTLNNVLLHKTDDINGTDGVAFHFTINYRNDV